HGHDKNGRRELPEAELLQYKTIYIMPFINKVDITNEAYTANKYRIYRPTLETDVTKAVKDRFFFDGGLKPAKEEGADLLLKGELIEYRKDPVRYDDNDNVTEYRINIIVNIILMDNLTPNKMVWQENGFTGNASYFTTGTNAKSEDTAINDALSDLAARIVERTVEQW
ncbi:MAG: LptE family protein, partial [Candidatus Omnitrophota bacterium]|nr:LptE family protein [Candidatus Omnitrophota bacterium]